MIPTITHNIPTIGEYLNIKIQSNCQTKGSNSHAQPPHPQVHTAHKLAKQQLHMTSLEVTEPEYPHFKSHCTCFLELQIVLYRLVYQTIDVLVALPGLQTCPNVCQCNFNVTVLYRPQAQHHVSQGVDSAVNTSDYQHNTCIFNTCEGSTFCGVLISHHIWKTIGSNDGDGDDTQRAA